MIQAGRGASLGLVLKTLPCNAEDPDLIPCQGRRHMLQGNEAWAPQVLKPLRSRACALQQAKPASAQLQSRSHSLQLEKFHGQQGRCITAENNILHSFYLNLFLILKYIFIQRIQAMVLNFGVIYYNSVDKEMLTHSSFLAWEIPQTGEAGGLQSLGSQRVRHDWVTERYNREPLWPVQQGLNKSNISFASGNTGVIIFTSTWPKKNQPGTNPFTERNSRQ